MQVLLRIIMILLRIILRILQMRIRMNNPIAIFWCSASFKPWISHCIKLSNPSTPRSTYSKMLSFRSILIFDFRFSNRLIFSLILYLNEFQIPHQQIEIIQYEKFRLFSKAVISLKILSKKLVKIALYYVLIFKFCINDLTKFYR